VSDNPHSTARRTALDLLARREHSSHELLEKLHERHPELDAELVLHPVIRQLIAENLQSDQRFVESYIRYRSSRGDGPLKITASLQPRKIASDLLKSALYEQGPDWVALCRQALQKKFRDFDQPSIAEQQRMQRFLQQRGFTGEQVRKVLRTREE
jgi:regulatory protein